MGGVRGVQWHGCLAEIVHFRCTSVGLLCAGVGWLGGASASKAVARDSLVSGAKAGSLRGVDVAEAGHVKGKEPKGRKASSITIGRSYSLSLVGVLVRIRMSFRFVP